MPHVESFENCGDIGFLTKTDSGTFFIVVDLNAEELACRAEVRDLVNPRESRKELISSCHNRRACLRP
jgi:hypothetical protein